MNQKTVKLLARAVIPHQGKQGYRAAKKFWNQTPRKKRAEYRRYLISQILT